MLAAATKKRVNLKRKATHFVAEGREVFETRQRMSGLTLADAMVVDNTPVNDGT